MKIYLKPEKSVFNLIPRIVAEQAGGSSLFRGRNYMWLFWMFVCKDYIKGDVK